MPRLPLVPLLLLATFIGAPCLHAQKALSSQHDHGFDGPPPDGPGGPGGMGGFHGGPMNPASRIVPPGLWWRQGDIAQTIGLSADQQKKMDGIFQDSRIQLIHMKASLEEEEVRLEPLLAANPPDTGKALDEIGKIADLRAGLEKADAKMLLALRSVLSTDQWTKLQAFEQAHRHGGGRFQGNMPAHDFSGHRSGMPQGSGAGAPPSPPPSGAPGAPQGS